jgi:hypothetical protein
MFFELRQRPSSKKELKDVVVELFEGQSEEVVPYIIIESI